MHLCTSHLSAENIGDLADGKLLAISAKNFIPPDVAELLLNAYCKAATNITKMLLA